MRYIVPILCCLIALTACSEEPGISGNTDVTGTDADVGGTDVASDVADTTAETSTEIAADTGVDTTADTGVDTIADTGVDTIADTGVDTTADTGVDTTADTGVDTAEVLTPSCAAPDECTNCAYRAKVTGPDACYCVFCASFPMTKTECAENQASWAAHCDPWPRPEPCPVASCLPAAPPLCTAGQCLKDPNGCAFTDDCGSCRFSEPPLTAADCHCPSCSGPLARDYCEVIELAISEVCIDFDYDKCQPPPCAFPPPIICGPEQTCGYGEFELPER